MDTSEEPYIVVSDVHLGSGECCKEEFTRFLDWVKQCRDNGNMIVQTQSGQRTLDPPNTIILLGDILELWAPRDSKPINIVRDSVLIFSKLISLDCKKVYVLGNHDAELCGDECDVGIMQQPFAGTLLEWVTARDSQFMVVPRHYPNYSGDPSNQPVQIGEGDKRYLFLHGHQFDRNFERVGPFVKIVPLIGGLAAAFDVSRLAEPLCFALTIFFLGLYFTSFRFLFPIDPLYILLLFVIVAYPGLSWFIARSMKSLWEFKERLAGIIAFSGREEALSSPSSVNMRLDDLKRSIYHLKIKPDPTKYKSIEQILYEGYFRVDKDLSKPKIMVFGHTHVPEICKPDTFHDKDGKQLYQEQLVNSGSWVYPPQEQADTLPYNTFVYIDRIGSTLFHWCDTEGEAREIPSKKCT